MVTSRSDPGEGGRTEWRPSAGAPNARSKEKDSGGNSTRGGINSFIVSVRAKRRGQASFDCVVVRADVLLSDTPFV